MPEWTDNDLEGGIYRLASSFDEFIGKLYIEPRMARELHEDAVASGDDEQLAAVVEWLNIGMPNWREALFV